MAEYLFILRYLFTIAAVHTMLDSDYLSSKGFYLPSGLGIKNYEIDYVAKTLNKILN